MRNFLLALCLWASWAHAWAQAPDSTELFEPAPYRLRFQSFEAAQVTGSLVLPLVIDTRQTLETVGFQSISDNKEYFQFDAAEMEQLGPVAANNQYTVNFTLSYDANERPESLPRPTNPLRRTIQSPHLEKL